MIRFNFLKSNEKVKVNKSLTVVEAFKSINHVYVCVCCVCACVRRYSVVRCVDYLFPTFSVYFFISNKKF